MTVRINFNLPALLSQASLTRTNLDLTTSIQRLSSGIRINRASDDPAGLVIADTMRHTQAALASASSNAETAVSMLQTADGGMDAIGNSLKRLRQLAVQGANDGTMDASQLRALQSEFDAAVDSIDKTAQSTKFGSIPLLQGGLADLTLSAAAKAAYSVAAFDATKLPAGVKDASTVKIDPPVGGPLAHDQVQVTLGNAGPLPLSGATPINGLTQNGTALTIAGSTAITLTGPHGAQSVTLTPATTIDDFVAVVNNGSSTTGLRAAYNPAMGVLTVESVGFGAGALSIASADLTGGANIGLLDTDTTGVANPLQSAPDTYVMALTKGGFAAAASDAVSSLVDAVTGDALDAVDGKRLTLYGKGTSATLTLTAGTTAQDVVDWVNANGATVGARASFTAGTLSIQGTAGPLTITADDMTSAGLQVGLMDERTDLMGANGALVKTATAANRTVDVHFTDANGNARTVTLTQDPTSPGGLTFSNVAPGPELTPPFSGWEPGAISVTLKDLSGGGFGATSAVATTTLTATRVSTMALQLGPQATDLRIVDVPDMRSAALGQTAFRADYLANGANGVLVTKGYRSLRDLVTSKALTSGGASEALQVIDAAINEVSAARGRAGSLQSDGVERTLDSLRVTSQNIQESESRIRDTDFAAESANVTRLQIMMQAATAMLAQANQVPQSVLQLLQHQ